MNPSPNNPLLVHPAALENRFGLLVAARLSAGAQDLPHDVTERLRAARVQAIARRKRPVSATQVQAAPAVLSNGHTAILGFGDDALGFWGRLTSLATVVALAVALVAVNVVQDDDRATEVADVDAALLTDALPPQAYADPGFLQFLKSTDGDHAAQAH